MDHLLRNTEGHYPSTKPWWGSEHLRQIDLSSNAVTVLFRPQASLGSESSFQKKGKDFGKGFHESRDLRPVEAEAAPAASSAPSSQRRPDCPNQYIQGNARTKSDGVSSSQ